MTNRRFMTGLVALLLAAACGDLGAPPQPTRAASALRSSALIGSFNVAVPFGNGLAADNAHLLYLSTGSGARETHIIDRVLQTDVGTIPTGGDPRDVTFDGTDLLLRRSERSGREADDRWRIRRFLRAAISRRRDRHRRRYHLSGRPESSQ